MSTVARRRVPIPSPVLTASGCSAFGRELEPFVDLTAIGAVVTKSVQLRPRSGRPTPRMAETPSGMLNSIGLQGPGIDGLLADELPWLAERGVRSLVSIAGTRVEDFAELAERLRGVPGVLGLEVNISCPNVESRGEVFACDPVAASDVVAAVRAAADPAHPVYAKLSPDVTDIVSVARAVTDAGADGLSMINTLLGLVIDPDTMRPVLGGVTGGLSGPAIRPVALRCVWQVHAALPRGADPRHGRHPHRAGRAAVRPRRGVGGLGRDGGVQRPVRASRGCTTSWPPRWASAGSPPCRRRRVRARDDMTRRFADVERLADAVAARGPLCVGIDPHAPAAGEVGPAATTRRPAPASPTRWSTRWPARSPSSSRSWPSTSGTGPAGSRCSRTPCRGPAPPGPWCCSTPSAGDIGSTMDAYARLPAPRPPAGRRRDDGEPVPRARTRCSRPSTPRALHGGGLFVLARTSNPDAGTLQHALVGERSVAQVVVDTVRGWNTPDWVVGDPLPDIAARPRPGEPLRAVDRLLRRRRRRHAARAWTSTSTGWAARSSPRASARRAARSPTCAGCSAPIAPSSPPSPATCWPPAGPGALRAAADRWTAELPVRRVPWIVGVGGTGRRGWCFASATGRDSAGQLHAAAVRRPARITWSGGGVWTGLRSARLSCSGCCADGSAAGCSVGGAGAPG